MREPSKDGTGVAASLTCSIGTVGSGSMEGPGETCEGEALRGGPDFRAVGAGRGTVGGIESDRSKPKFTAAWGLPAAATRRRQIRDEMGPDGRNDGWAV